jgi:predicted  nucleic acid-binding Zn-ribbon protein
MSNNANTPTAPATAQTEAKAPVPPHVAEINKLIDDLQNGAQRIEQELNHLRNAVATKEKDLVATIGACDGLRELLKRFQKADEADKAVKAAIAAVATDESNKVAEFPADKKRK